MEPQTKLLLFEILTAMFVCAWAIQAFYIHKLLNQIKVMAKVHSQLLVSAAEIQLAKSTIEMSQNVFTATKLINDSVGIVGERLSGYNERLNELTSAVRTKVNRIDGH
jgi:hypothetical protein